MDQIYSDILKIISLTEKDDSEILIWHLPSEKRKSVIHYLQRE